MKRLRLDKHHMNTKGERWIKGRQIRHRNNNIDNLLDRQQRKPVMVDGCGYRKEFEKTNRNLDSSSIKISNISNNLQVNIDKTQKKQSM